MNLLSDKSKMFEKLFKTPYYLWDIDLLGARIKYALSILTQYVPNMRLFFAAKANSSKFIFKAVFESGINVDVCSVDELKLALEAGFPPERISACLFAPSKNELLKFVRVGCNVDFDSLEDLEILTKMDKSSDKIGIRINPDVRAGFHEHCSSGVWNSKFGIAIADVGKTVDFANKHGKKINGLHIHVGSSSYNPEPYLDAIEIMLQTAVQHSLNLRYLNIGGGWGIPFDRQDDSSASIQFPLKEYAKGIARLIEKYHIGEHVEIRAEPGEYLVGPCGFLVSTVRRVVKRQNGVRQQRIVVVDAGSYLYPGPALYGSDNFVYLLNREESCLERQVLAGRSMMAGDIFGPEREMPLLRQGDIVAIGCAGAYSQVKACRFNLLPQAKEYCLKNGQYYKK